jgi:hypothetical protein
MSVIADSAATAVVVVSSTPGSPPGTPVPGSVAAASSLWQVEVCDRNGNPLAELSTIAFDLQLNRGLNRPAMASLKVPAWHAYANTIHSDGSPYVEVGVRTIKLRRRDTPSSAWQIVFNGFVWHLEDEGDEDETWTQLTAYDPMILWRFRPARGFDYSRKTKKLTYNGNFAAPVWVKPRQTECAPVLLRTMLDHSRTTATGGLSGDTPLGEGSLCISLTAGTVEESGDDASGILDLSDTPVNISDLHKLLTDSRSLDAWIEPVDQVGSDVMGNLMAVARAGTDKPWLHLQYGTGNYSVAKLKRERDMDNVVNKLYYYLGRKLDELHWQGNVTMDGMPKGASDTGDPRGGGPLPDSPPGMRAAVEARVANSRAKYPVMMSISIYDQNKNMANKFFSQFGKMWQMEAWLRAEPREMLYVTPTRNGPYDIFDLDPGDTIRVSAFDGVRRGFTAAVQRIYGYTITVDPDMVEAITELETSPNAE